MLYNWNEIERGIRR